MTQDEIIRMAIDAGLGEYLHLDGWRFTPDGDDIKSLERFYELAYATGAAHEREKQADISALPIIIEVAVKEAVIAEREACAKLVETTHAEGLQSIREACAAAIRARNMPND